MLCLGACFFFPLGYVLHNRLMQMYENMNEEMKESIRTGKLETV
jgi:hypothetical protein